MKNYVVADPDPRFAIDLNVEPEKYMWNQPDFVANPDLLINSDADPVKICDPRKKLLIRISPSKIKINSIFSGTCCVTERINLLDKFQSPKYRGRTVSNSINTCGGGRSIVTERINLSDKFQSSNYRDRTCVQLYKYMW